MQRGDPNWRAELKDGDEVVYQDKPYTIVWAYINSGICSLKAVNSGDDNVPTVPIADLS